jgi:hypothetical protein
MISGMELIPVAYRLLGELRKCGAIGVESNQRDYGALIVAMSKALGVHEVDLREVVQALSEKSYIQIDNRPGFSGIYRATLTNRGQAILDKREEESAAAAVRSDASPIIFISCGQFSPNEKTIGKTLAEIVRSETSSVGFFAENQSSLASLSTHVLGALYKCSGFVAVLHNRGTGNLGGHPFERASVWVEQEIAIAAFLVQVLERDIPVQVYIQRGIELAGIRQLLTTNPVSFDDEREIESHFRSIVRERFGATTSQSSVSGEPANPASPLVPKMMALVTPAMANAAASFYGIDVRPWSYSPTVKVLDALDEHAIVESVRKTAAKGLHHELPATTSGPSVLFRAHLPEHRGSRKIDQREPPLEAIEVVSDGDISILVPEDSALESTFRLLALFGTAYTLVNDIYPMLGLQRRVCLTTTIRANEVDANGNYIPRLSTQAAVTDFDLDTFPAAFRDLFIATLRDGGRSMTRQLATSMLEQFKTDRLP